MHSRASKFIGIAVLLGLWLTGQPAYAARASHILVINSHQQGLPWTYRMMSSLESTLVMANADVELDVDFMHTARFIPGQEYFEKRAAVYGFEFHKFKFDVVISVGEDAFRYVMYYRERLFDGTPIIFCGVSMSTTAAANGCRTCVVISSDWNLKGSVELIRRLCPTARHIVFVHDGTSEGRAMAGDAKMIAPEFPKLDFQFLTDLTMADLLAHIKHLPPDAVLVPLPFTIDKSGQFYAPGKAVAMMAAASPVPVFGLWVFEMEDGVTGGLVLDEGEYGKHIAQAALRVARGEDVKTISAKRIGVGRYTFDYTKLSQFGIPVSQLPRGARILHKPASTYRVHRKAILAAIGTFLLLLGTVAALGVTTLRRKRAEEARLRTEREISEHKRRFLRETILSVTEGKLRICDSEELQRYTIDAQIQAPIREPHDVPSARSAVRAYCQSKGVTGERLDAFVIGVGEAMANAVKHAPAGHVYAGTEGDDLWVAVVDEGQGIDSLILPRVALQRGFSTKVSLGMGYTVMLDVADCVELATSEQGTIVVLFKCLHEVTEELSPETGDDAW